MKLSQIGSLSFATALALGALVHTAAAEDVDGDGDNDRRAITLGAQLQYGISTNDDYEDANPYSLGVGARLGVTLDPGIYVGGAFDYFLGEKRDASGPLGSSASGRINAYDLMAEVGYDAYVGGSSVLRPKLGIGVGFVSGEVCGTALGSIACSDETESGIAIAPGLQYLYFFDSLYLSLEARFQLISIDGSDPSALVLGAGLGAAL